MDGSSKPVAGHGVGDGQGKEADACSQQNDVPHGYGSWI